MSNVIVILGPTASGKSKLAVDLALRLGKKRTEIISADSRQVYIGLNIGAGKITKKEMRGVPHHLLDVASLRRTFTAHDYQKLGGRTLKNILAQGKIPIICGGTGFYIDSLLYNYSLPEVKPNIPLRKKLDGLSAEALFKKLEKLDPARAGVIDPHNKRRLIRALEIVLGTKKPIPLLIKKSSYRILKIGITLPDGILKKKINVRLTQRLSHGLIPEVKRLRASGVSSKKLEGLGLEYRYINRFLENKVTKKEMTETLEKEIWRYAKRQMTWFKRDPEIHWLNSKAKKEASNLIDAFLRQSAGISEPNQR